MHFAFLERPRETNGTGDVAVATASPIKGAHPRSS